ncbi:MAG: alpha/beta hydrolase [Clostridia bacterium]|nr:alpha/beta hydrolase [Clostridia bacterium]
MKLKTEVENQYIQEPEYDNYDEAVQNDEYDDEYYEESKLRIFLRRIFNKRIIASVIAAVIVITLAWETVAGIAVSAVVTEPEMFLKTEKSRNVLREPLSEQEYLDWFDSNAEDVFLRNSEDKSLHGFSLKNYSTSHSYVIICHSMTANARDMAVFAHHFFDLGFNVLLPESRGFGESEYEKTTFGYRERYDIADWVNMIVEEDADSAIFLYGMGLGGSTVLMASSLEMPDNVKGIISDSAYANLHDLFKENAKEMYKLPSFPLVSIASTYNGIVNDWKFKDVDVIEQVRKSAFPILFIHGGDDRIVPVEHSNDMYEACTVEGSDHLHISGASHCGAMSRKTEKYWMNVDSFILDNIEN